MDPSDEALRDYYARRAAEYERIYEKPERQKDLLHLREVLGVTFPGDDVLEIACGTGYWTEVIAGSARSIVAVDANAEVLAIAARKDYRACRVSFVTADAYRPIETIPDRTAGFHAFWWSHLPIARIPFFLEAFHAGLAPGARVVMIDNLFVAGSSTPISRRDGQGNTYQVRRLADGSEHEVLKNFPTREEIARHLDRRGMDLRFTELAYYWIAEYRRI
jgi:demethylmenaquinone methyltransferase/2-methoxy-6-polyprenyl-1,4-benzoquinol methylase